MFDKVAVAYGLQRPIFDPASGTVFKSNDFEKGLFKLLTRQKAGIVRINLAWVMREKFYFDDKKVGLEREISDQGFVKISIHSEDGQLAVAKT